MIRRISIFLIALLTIGFACFLFYLNPDSITVRYSSQGTWSAPLAIVLISVFFFGAAFIGIIGVYLSTKRSVTDWLSRQKTKRQRTHERLLLDGRSALATKNFDVSREKFKRVVTEDKNNTLAWLLLADATEESQGVHAALRVLEDGRKSNSANIELLFRAAEINEHLGNLTAAFDNLKLIQQQQPDNVPALKKIIVHAEQLLKYEDAVSACEELLRFLPYEAREQYQEKLASLEVRAIVAKHREDAAARREGLERVLRKHRNCPEALAALATEALQDKKYADASQLYARAYQHSGKTTFLDGISSLWLDIDDPDKAIASVRSAVVSSKKNATPGKLYLSHLYLSLEMLEEAERTLNELTADTLSATESAFKTFLIAKIRRRSGDAEKAYDMLSRVIEGSDLLPDYVGCVDKRGSNGQAKITWKGRRTPRLEAPSPRLSTP